jgi:hypothetical protein
MDIVTIRASSPEYAQRKVFSLVRYHVLMVEYRKKFHGLNGMCKACLQAIPKGRVFRYEPFASQEDLDEFSEFIFK